MRRGGTGGGGMGWWTWRRLRQQWLQSVFIVLGLGVGVAVLTTVATNLWASERQSQEWFSRSGELENVYVQPRLGRDTSLFGPDAPVATLITGDERPVERVQFSLADMMAARQEVPGVGATLLGGMSFASLPVMGIDGEPVSGAVAAAAAQPQAGAEAGSGRRVGGQPGAAAQDGAGLLPPPDSQINVAQVTPDQFGIDQARLLAGTLLTWDDFAAGRLGLVVEETWVRSVFPHLSTAADAVGRTLTTWIGAPGARHGATWTIVGVIADLPKDLPWRTVPERSRLGGRPIKGLAFSCWTSTQMMWRRVEGATQDAAGVAVPRETQFTFGQLTFRPAQGVTPAELARRLQAFFDVRLGAGKVEATTLASQMAEGNALRWRYLGTLAGLASLALIVGAVNVLNLNLAYVFQRQRYLGLAAALGASRRRLLWQSLSDSMTLGAVGGALGVGLTIPGLRLLRAVQQMDMPVDALSAQRLQALWQPNLALLAMGCGIALLISLVFGLIPALQAQRISPAEALRE